MTELEKIYNAGRYDDLLMEADKLIHSLEEEDMEMNVRLDEQHGIRIWKGLAHHAKGQDDVALTLLTNSFAYLESSYRDDDPSYKTMEDYLVSCNDLWNEGYKLLNKLKIKSK